MSPSEFTLPALLKLHCILLSLSSSQENVSDKTKKADYFLSIYFPVLLNNKDFSWAQGHLATDIILQFSSKLSANHVALSWSVAYAHGSAEL